MSHMSTIAGQLAQRSVAADAGVMGCVACLSALGLAHQMLDNDQQVYRFLVLFKTFFILLCGQTPGG